MNHVFSLIYTIAQRLISAALFGILLLLSFAVTSGMGDQAYFGFYRYDYLFFCAVLIQVLMLYLKLESLNEAKVIALFHVMAMCMELVLTAPHIGSWQYPEPAVLKLLTVPLFAGFMYSAVGSFFVRAIRLFEVSFICLPRLYHMSALAILAFINFMSKFFIIDIRSVLFIWSIFIFWRTKVLFKVNQNNIRLPILPILVFFAFLIWIAENISTFYDIWVYPNQAYGWRLVWLGKIGSWYLLLLLSFVSVLVLLGKRQSNGSWRMREHFIGHKKR
ncbi:DUF817 family protein [Acinetobacter boissieri]|uniref:Uncharacterized membrane protein YoaT, DUF817 family n=1 Tax=Acinetobacter boissieri TaxID=1219383 RepID=A0A1G6IIS8_9GAMM|nr:DUF817 family protein [Acinetobacter boissieri]SDC06398.1 Uncharacterized membrane protein YoaT, DUF817 family [Acinetobacter boissieri]